MSRRSKRTRRTVVDDKESDSNDISVSTSKYNYGHSTRLDRMYAEGSANVLPKEESTNIIGKIKLVSVTDFVTYDKVDFYPGDNLNIIIGPNGTGKSTIVSAIVLGLGGTPALLSRATSVQDYVKNGKQTAIILISIYKNDNRDVMNFKRTFDISGSNTWLVDDKRVSGSQYLKIVKNFKIQIDNLCQFLPQDRVQDFAKMNAQEILANTQSSVCSPEIILAHENLIKMRFEQKNEQKSLAQNTMQLREHEERVQLLKVQIDNMNARKALFEKLEICKKKKVWMEFEERYSKVNETESDLEKAKENLVKVKNELKPLLDSMKAITNVKVNIESAMKTATDDVQKFLTELRKLDDNTNQLEDSVNKARGDLQFAITSLNERDNEINVATQLQAGLLVDLKRVMNEAGSETDKNQKINEINNLLNDMKNQIQKQMEKRRFHTQHLEEVLNPQMLVLKRKISNIENVGDAKLQWLRNKQPDAYKAVMWLRENHHLLTGKVYEPMVLELNLKDNKDAKYFENHIAYRDLIAFTCERKEDMTYLFKKFRTEMQLSVNMLHSDASDCIEFDSNIHISELRKYGCQSYLIDLIEGPYPILNYLCRTYRIHNVPIGNDQTFEMADEMPTTIQVFFTTHHRFSIIVSKYSGQKSSDSVEISGRNILSSGVDMTLLNGEKQKLAKLMTEIDKHKNHRNKVEDTIKEFELKRNDLLNEKQQLNSKFTAVQTCREKLNRQMKKIQDLNDSLRDVNKEKEIFEKKSKETIDKLITIQKQKINDYMQYNSSVKKYEHSRQKLNTFNVINADLHNRVLDKQNSFDRAKGFVDKIMEILNRLKNECKSKKTEACNLTDGKTPDDVDFPYKRQFQKLPSVLEELVQLMDEIQGETECLHTQDQSIIDDYETRIRSIAELKELINNSDGRKVELENEMNVLHTEWFTELNRIVSIINENFSKFMCSMEYAGEIQIIRNDERDYAEYGIQILVKYRNEEKLQALDRYVQSGGERAVAIAVYTLSLQHITHVPFRCVDEINQGMDPRNERKIFNMLIDQTAQEGKSQYFFVTPKLLPNLAYNDLMSVHVVHNGPHLEPDIFDRN